MLAEQGSGLCVRIFIGESDQHENMTLYEWIVQEARARNLAGATVWRGIAGFGANSLIHTNKILRLSEDLPVVIEIVDTPDKINEFLDVLDEVIQEGMVMVDEVKIRFYRAKVAE